MIADHLEPKGLAPNAEPIAAVQTMLVAREDAQRGSLRLMEAILKAKGCPIPQRPRKPAPEPRLCPACFTPLTPYNGAIATIQQTVAAYYGLHPGAMTSADRRQKIARPRQIAMYLATELTKHSIAAIGRRFNRDHTTVLHAIKAVERRSGSDHQEAFDVSLLRERLTA